MPERFNLTSSASQEDLLQHLVLTHAVQQAILHFSEASTLQQLAQQALLSLNQLNLNLSGSLFFLERPGALSEWLGLAGTGEHANCHCEPLEEFSEHILNALTHTIQHQTSQYTTEFIALFLKARKSQTQAVILLERDGSSLDEFGRTQLHLFCHQLGNCIDQLAMEQQLWQTQQATIMTLAMMAEYKDVDTSDHLTRVARLSTEIAEALIAQGKIPDPQEQAELALIGIASLLHDVGKVIIDPKILLKPGPLNPEERQAMQKHSEYGYEMLMRSGGIQGNSHLLLQVAAQIARWHHERWDGAGYPDRLSGKGIPLAARIVAAVDVYDALGSRRPYKEPWSEEKVLSFMQENAGQHFDPLVVEALLHVHTQKQTLNRVHWTEEMSVRHPDLDTDHQRLIALFNELAYSRLSGNRQVIGLVLSDLSEYTQRHFRREEEIMASFGYPDLAAHKRIHAQIEQKVERVRWEFQQGVRDELQDELLVFMTTWLFDHILHTDKDYASVLPDELLSSATQAS